MIMDDLEINDHVEPSVFGEDEDDPFAIPPPLAALPPPGEETGDIAAENGVLDLDGGTGGGDATATQETKTKKRAPRPRIKLDEARLSSPKGLAALKDITSNIQLKGKGHEASDLNKLLQQFEHWAQCLMPKWPFQNVVAQCEKLGNKRITQNELHRLRRGENDEVLRGESEDEEESGATGETSGETQIPGEQPVPTTPELDQLVEERPTPLTEEQLERIRKNRVLAMARREAIQKRKLLAEKALQEQSGLDNGNESQPQMSDVEQNSVNTNTRSEDTANGSPLSSMNQDSLPDQETMTAVEESMSNNVPLKGEPEEIRTMEEDTVVQNAGGDDENVAEHNIDISNLVTGGTNSQMVDTNVNKPYLTTENRLDNKTVIHNNFTNDTEQDFDIEETNHTPETNNNNASAKVVNLQNTEEDEEPMSIDMEGLNGHTINNLSQKENINTKTVEQNGVHENFEINGIDDKMES